MWGHGTHSTQRRMDSLAEEMWQLNQSYEAKSRDLENDFDEVAARAKECGSSNDDDTSGAWIERP